MSDNLEITEDAVFMPEEQQQAERQLRRVRRADVRRRLNANEDERRTYWAARTRLERLEEMMRVLGRHFLCEFETWSDRRLTYVITDLELEHALNLIDVDPRAVPAELTRLSTRQ